MVERNKTLDSIFHCLSDPTRRDMLRRLVGKDMSVGELATAYRLTFAAISKHLQVLEAAGLITKKRKGKQQIVRLSPRALEPAAIYLESYGRKLKERMDSLEKYLKNTK